MRNIANPHFDAVEDTHLVRYSKFLCVGAILEDECVVLKLDSVGSMRSLFVFKASERQMERVL